MKDLLNFLTKLLTFLKKILKQYSNHYNEIKRIENDKLMKPNIKRAYIAVQFQIIIVSLIYSILIIFYTINTNIIPVIIVIFLCFCLLLIMCYCSKRWIDQALETNKILLATNIFIAINIYGVIVVMSAFKYIEGYTDYDRGIAFPLNYYWLFYFFTLIPGNFFVKLLSYLFTVIFILAIMQPPLCFGTYLFIGHVIANCIQLFLSWEKYHEESFLINSIEYEKNISNFLQSKFPEPIFTLDNSLNILKLNERASQLFLESNKLFFKDFAFDYMNEQGNNLYDELFNHPEIENIQFLKRKSEFQTVRMVVSSSCFQFDSKKIIILILKDITELLRIQERNMSEKYQNILLFSAPHEIRSQLNLISGNLEQLEKKFDLQILKIAQFAAKVMEYKLNIIFDFVHITTNKFAEHCKQFNFKALVEEIGDIINHFASIKNLNFEIKYRTKNFNLIADIDRFVSILIHVSLNAVKHTFQGKIILKVIFRNGYLHAKISDSGIGMNQSIVDYINQFSKNKHFDNFIIIQEALKNLCEIKFLSGIGTVTSALLCKKLGGNLIINSKNGIGTNVSLKILCKKVSTTIEEIDDDSCIPNSERSLNNLSLTNLVISSNIANKSNNKIGNQQYAEDKKLKIIVVDDQPFNRLTLVKMLESLNINNVAESENGQEAVKVTRQFLSCFDQITIFMDIEMPILNGIEATKLIKEEDKCGKVKVVMLSAFNSEEIISECYKAGAIDFYVKPISFKKLKEMKESKFIIF